MLLRYVRGGSDNTDRDSTEQSLTTCLKHGMSADSEPFMLVASDSIRAAMRSLYPKIEIPRSAEAILDLLAINEVSRQLGIDGIRYLVLLDGSLTTTASEWDGHGGRGGVIIVRTWKKISVLEVTIVDVRNLRISGRLRASSEGQEAAGVGLALIFPFPVGWWSMPESRACGELGAAIARFISSEPDSAQQKN
jgi:hypothetical protein